MHTVDTKEIENFAKDSSKWWDEHGPFRPLHRLNPVRLSYIKDQICNHFGKDHMSFKPYDGLSVLDIGCGGGLVCEPMRRLGANVTGIDADKNAIAVASNHAKDSDLNIEYLCASTDDISTQKKKYDVVLALEIIEHVADPQKFVDDISSLCKPNGLIIFSTINRTAKSFALAKIAAEYIVRWVPAGTHDWKKFIKPSELSKMVRNTSGRVGNIEGMIYNPIKGEFKRSADDLDVNYFLVHLKT
jgi:2-polyprenyl-6-hydroxyphenyl methylase / 3-demethylubiquinone-9 3-methyltransferase